MQIYNKPRPPKQRLSNHILATVARHTRLKLATYSNDLALFPKVTDVKKNRKNTFYSNLVQALIEGG